MALYFYTVDAAREQFVVIIFTFFLFLVRLANVSISWNTLVDPRAGVGGGTVPALVAMGVMAVTNAIWWV